MLQEELCMNLRSSISCSCSCCCGGLKGLQQQAHSMLAFSWIQTGQGDAWGRLSLRGTAMGYMGPGAAAVRGRSRVRGVHLEEQTAAGVDMRQTTACLDYAQLLLAGTCCQEGSG
jgi:hypothetical protein